MQQHNTTTQGPASSPSAQQQALGCSSRNKGQESLARSSEECDFLSFFSLPLYPAQIPPKSPALGSTFGTPQSVFPDVSKHKCVSTSLFLLLIFQGMLVPFHASLPSPYTPKANTQCMCVWETASTASSEKKKLQWIFECCLPMRSFDQLPGDDRWSALISLFLWLFPSRGQRARLIGLKSEMMPFGISLFLIVSAVSSCLLRASLFEENSMTSAQLSQTCCKTTGEWGQTKLLLGCLC